MNLLSGLFHSNMINKKLKESSKSQQNQLKVKKKKQKSGRHVSKSELNVQ